MQIDNATTMNNDTLTSVYVPIIGKNITTEYIENCFHEKNVGKVLRVDFVINKQKGGRREAFIHFSEWYETQEAAQVKNDMTAELGCKFMHNEHNFWPLLKNKNPLDKNSPDRKSNSAYELEERLEKIEAEMNKLTFMTKLHDANIQFIIKQAGLNNDYNKKPDFQPVKRHKSNEYDSSRK